MPCVHVKTNMKVDSSKAENIKSALGEKIQILHKSESWLMVEIEDDKMIWFQGQDAPCAMVKVELYGSADRNSCDKMTQAVTDLIFDELGIAKNRVYVNYSEFDTWGYNGGNF